MARYKYDLQYEIRLNSNAWIDISALADSRKLSIQRNSCTTEFKSAIDSASFTLQPKPALYDLRAEVVNILMEATDNANHAYVRISKRNTMPDEDPVIFLGVVDASSISITTLRIPQAITIQCQDISIVNLDNVPSQYIVLENKKTSEIVRTLIEHAGFVVGSVDIKAEDDVYHRAFVAYSDKDDTYRDYIDTLLFEAGGYALDCGKNGLMNIIRIRIGENTEGARLVDNYLDAEGINSSTSILDSDGIKLKWSTIAETHPDSPQTVYVDDINREIDDETGILKGDEILPGEYWPENGNIDKTYFEYEAEFLDREYQSGQKKNVNEDLSLILVKNVSASVNVWTEDGVQLNPEDVFDYPIPAGFEEETNPAYYPDKAWWLLHNKSGQNLNLTSFSIQGDCIYRDRINTLLMPSTSAKPEEYESVYIYTAEQAQKFARFYHDIKKYARTQHSWSELGIVEVGSLVKIAHKTTDIGQVAYVVQVTYSYIGDRIKSDCIAISIGPYNEYNFRQWGQNNGANDSSAAISSITDYYLASSEYQGVTVNTPGWSTDADYGADDSKPYLWKYTKTQYVNGKVENSKPVIIAVKGDAKTIKSIDTEYALADSSVTPPAEDSDAWQDTLPAKTDQSQSIWKRTVITYSDGTIEYTDVIVLSGLIVFQYAYGKSAVNPPTPSIWIWGKKFMVWGNLFISSEGSAIWSATRPEKPEGQWYLWMRISTDGGQTWNDPVCISGNDAIGYELSYSPATYQMTDRGIVKTRGQYIDFFLDISNIPYNANDIVWNVEANGETPLVKGTDWDILDNDPTQIRVTFPYNFKSTSFTVSVVITGYEDMAKTRTVGATIIENSTAEYLDVVTELPEDGDNVTSRGPLKDGDYILLETINENDKQERIPYRWTVVEGIGKWVPVGGDNRPSNYAEIMAGSLADALKSDITQNSVNAFYGFIRDLISQNATVVNLFSKFIQVLAAIYGGDYTKEGFHITNPDDQKYNGRGFHLSVDGRLQASDAELNGSFECRDDLGIVLKTLYGAIGGAAVSNSPTRWDSRTLVEIASKYFDSHPDQNWGTVFGTYVKDGVEQRVQINIFRAGNNPEIEWVRFQNEFTSGITGIYLAPPVPYDSKAHIKGEAFRTGRHAIYLNGKKITSDYFSTENGVLDVDMYIDVKKGDIFSFENVYWEYNTWFLIYLTADTKDTFVRIVNWDGWDVDYPFGEPGVLKVDPLLHIYFNRRESNNNRVTINYFNFDSDNYLTLAEITNFADIIGNQGATFSDLSRIYIDDIEYTPVSAFVLNDIIYMQVSDGQIFTFERYVDTSNHSSAGWYNISGYLITESEQRGVEISDLIPVDNTVQIGSSQKSFSNAYIKVITTTNLFADVLKASQINASDLPRSEIEADVNGIYIDENGFLKIKQ